MSDTQLASMRLGSMDADAIDELRRSRGGNNIFILDGKTSEYLDHIHRVNVLENKHTQSLADNLETFDMTVIGDKPYAQYLGNRNTLIVPGEDGEMLEFRIFEVGKYRRDSMLVVDVYSSATFLDLKTAKVFDPQTTDAMTAVQHATQALSGTEWQVGNVDYSGIRTLTFDSPFNSYQYLKRIASEFELELRFYVTTDGQKVTGRYVDIVEQVGEWRGRTIEFGTDLQGIRRTEKTENVVTALYGYGPEREDGTRLKVFVEDEDALQRWGRNGRHIVDIYEPQSDRQDMTIEELRQYTRTELNKRINAIVEYEADIVDLENVPGMENKKIRFGDTIRIKDTKFQPALYVEARVHKQERDVFTKANKRVELGDFVEYTEEEVRAIWKQLQEQIRQKISQAELVEYAERKVQRDMIPPENTEHLWLDTSVEPNVLKRYDGTEWVKATPTEADEVGAETPQGAQDKADQAEQSAKDHADTVADQAKQEAISYSENFTINYAQKQITSSATPPEDPEIGDLWFDNSTQPPTFRRWNGTEWEKLSATTFEELEGMIDKSQLPDRVIDSMKLAIDAVQEENLSEDSVYAEAIQAEAVGAQAIAANAILAKHIAAGEVTANHLSADAVTADAIAAGAILAEHISANSINSSKIATEGLNANVIKTGVLDADLVAVRSSNSGTYIDSDGILVNSGSFRLRDEITQVESMVRENANMINDHSFEMVKRTDTSFGDAVFQVDRSNMGNYFWWNIQATDPAYAQIQTTYGTDDVQRAKFGLQAAVLRNVSEAYWYQYIELNHERGTEGPYTISCYFSAFEKTTSATTCDIVVQAYDFDINWLDDVGRATVVVNPSEPYVWRRAYATVRNLPQGTAYIRIRINTRGGFALADGVQLVPFDRPIVYEAEEGLWRTLRSSPGYIAPLLTVDQLNTLDRVLLRGASEIYRDTGGYVRIRSIAGQHNGSIVINSNTQEVLIYQNGAFRHSFNPDGSKDGGSIEIDGKVLGMSPVDSPQVLIEYIEFDVPLEPDGVKVYLEERYRKAVANFAVFPNNGTVVEKGDDYFIIAGEGTADIRIVGERVEYEGTFWDDMDAYKEEMEENETSNAETGTENREIDRRRKGEG